ncbi:hypothetical protein KPH14_012502 [Odynerus spinipes]|uniref:RING-type domain-containing protein n=1 Tax=Odynerus spinipes TaxID=1348599 RepID=A0AAD9VMP5_9HYME|nr:hypothetical protein KPH14_012502 [Odynerus spinipes]
MQDFSHVLSECEEINQVLHKPINSTQRIKYTCLNVSRNYIILGSTSGSIYLFNREPCTFQQLIPLSEGIVSHVSISPDEKTIALATTRGVVCIVTLKPTIKLVATSTEHAYEKITCLCWNDNSSEVYIGDGTGKVSVVVLSIFTVNGMFQSPSCTLMNLDSSIIQLNFSSPLLLVSTLTRCYICDTVQEQYKQIGNKARNGEFGACFYKVQTDQNIKTATVKKGQDPVKKKSTFNFIPESNSNISESTCPKIFCARPGSRLWEISGNGVVLKTHQFKELLAIPPTKIHKVTMTESEQRKYINQPWTSQSVNFSQLFVIASKYLFSYTSSGLYIFDPVSPKIVLWNNEFTNITMADVIENKIYLMSSSNEFYCLTLFTLDALILHLYYDKQYYNCLETCITYKSELLKLISNKHIDDIFNVENNQQKLLSDEISVLLQPLISILRSNISTSPIKLDSGIVVVHSGNSKPKYNEDQQNKLMDQICSSSESIQMSSTQNPDTGAVVDNVLELNSNLSALEEDLVREIKTELESIHTLASSIKASMTEKEVEEIILNVHKKTDNIEHVQRMSSQSHDLAHDIIYTAKINYLRTFLKNVSTELLHSTTNKFITDHFMDAFILINMYNYKECTCGFPYPIDEIKEPIFIEIGKALLENFVNRSTERCMYLCNRVPYMWREYTSLYIKHQYALEDVLRQCLQIRDSITLSIILPILDVNQWKSITMYLERIKEGKCLSCEKLITVETKYDKPSLNWNKIIFEIMKKDGPDTAITFLKKLEGILPLESFDRRIFQSIIFTKILHHHGLQFAVDFNKCNSNIREYNTMCSSKIQNQLIEVLKKDLGQSVNKNIFGTGSHHWGMQYESNNKSSTCPCCTLSLQTPILLDNNGIAIFPCGHTFHVNCMIEKKLTKCNLH